MAVGFATLPVRPGWTTIAAVPRIRFAPPAFAKVFAFPELAPVWVILADWPIAVAAAP